VTAEDGPSTPTLGAVVEALGAGVVRVRAAPRGLDVPVGEPVVHDPVGEPVAGPGDVVLAVGVDPALRSAVDVVGRYGECGACAVLVRCDDDPPAGLVAAAEEAGVALLVAPSGAAWGQLHTLLRTARSATGQGRTGSAHLGDLFALADAVSSLVGGAATIEDPSSVVLAHSSTAHPVDGPRRDTILGRRVPDEWLARLHERGVFRRLWSSDDVVRVELDGIAGRLAVAVRAGGEVLGSIWVQEGDRPLGAEAEQALREAASMAALHLIRARSGEDLERRRAGEQLRAALDGDLPAAVLGEPLGVGAGDPVVLLALEPVGADQDAGVLVLERLVDLVVLACTAFRRRVVAAVCGRTAYAVLDGRNADAVTARSLADDLSARVRTGLRLEVRACVVDEPGGLAALSPARQRVDLGLRVLAGRGLQTTVHASDLHAATVLLRLRDLAADRPELAEGKVAVLRTSDRERETSYVPTLRAYLDAHGDVRLAADLVGVHPNTFRYRLRRLSELAGLDLDDPVERLVAHLQLHLASGAS
jgi:hypothetical protein